MIRVLFYKTKVYARVSHCKSTAGDTIRVPASLKFHENISNKLLKVPNAQKNRMLTGYLSVDKLFAQLIRKKEDAPVRRLCVREKQEYLYDIPVVLFLLFCCFVTLLLLSKSRCTDTQGLFAKQIFLEGAQFDQC